MVRGLLRILILPQRAFCPFSLGLVIIAPCFLTYPNTAYWEVMYTKFVDQLLGVSNVIVMKSYPSIMTSWKSIVHNMLFKKDIHSLSTLFPSNTTMELNLASPSAGGRPTGFGAFFCANSRERDRCYRATHQLSDPRWLFALVEVKAARQSVLGRRQPRRDAHAGSKTTRRKATTHRLTSNQLHIST